MANHNLFVNDQKEKLKKKKLLEFEISFLSTDEARQRPLWSYQLPFMAFPLSSPVVSRRFSLSSPLHITKHTFLHSNSIFRFTHSSRTSVLPKLSSNSHNHSSLVGSAFTLQLFNSSFISQCGFNFPLQLLLRNVSRFLFSFGDLCSLT